MVILVDTNILIDALNAKRGRREHLHTLVLGGTRLACCTVTVAEIYSGMRPNEAARTDEFLAALAWYPSSRAIARRAGRLRYEWAQRGHTLTLADTLIAATALEHTLALLTANPRHFPFPGLDLAPAD